MTKEEILDYVVNSPENTNRRVLNDMIDELVNSSSGGGLQTIKPTISAFVDGQLPDGTYDSTRGYYQITFTGLAYNSLYILDFSMSDLPANPRADMVPDQTLSSFRLDMMGGPIWYFYNPYIEEAQMYDLLYTNDPIVRSSEVSSGGATVVCFLVYKADLA